MNRKVFQDFANTLPIMLVSDRIDKDLETLAELPDGTFSFNILKGTVNHSTAGAVQLRIVEELAAWLRSRLITLGIPEDALCEAILILHVRTDLIPTDRKRLISFDFLSESRLVTSDRTYQGSSSNHMYHSRMIGKQEDEANVE